MKDKAQRPQAAASGGKCPRCKGSGRVVDRRTKKMKACLDCRGTGNAPSGYHVKG